MKCKRLYEWVMPWEFSLYRMDEPLDSLRTLLAAFGPAMLRCSKDHVLVSFANPARGAVVIVRPGYYSPVDFPD